MNNPWKLATLALVLTGVTAVSTGLTTAYMMRSSDGASSGAGTSPESLATVAPAPVIAPAVVKTTRPAPIVRTVQASPEKTYAPTPVPVQQVATAAIETDCATGGQRAMKIAKPGLTGDTGGRGARRHRWRDHERRQRRRQGRADRWYRRRGARHRLRRLQDEAGVRHDLRQHQLLGCLTRHGARGASRAPPIPPRSGLPAVNPALPRAARFSACYRACDALAMG